MGSLMLSRDPRLLPSPTAHFTGHNEVMLFGASDSYSGDSIMQVTVAFNHFGRGLVQRMPRCRWGFFHVVNNDYTHWLLYAIYWW
ncbi:hypothetical protein L1049_006730 [Liquidambar formosana]|uniref:Pectate lyase domain-containing protein n=1 Tax=Liquidambar formosana TaxID=63359 RepID=A0AAP0RG11_LIQFO